MVKGGFSPPFIFAKNKPSVFMTDGFVFTDIYLRPFGRYITSFIVETVINASGSVLVT